MIRAAAPRLKHHKAPLTYCSGNYFAASISRKAAGQT
jgi:hypothetical protein